MVSLLRARADLPGGRAALCAFADRPTTQRVNIFTSPSKKNPPGVRAKPYTLPLLPNLFTCYWFASGEEEGSACHGLPPCPLPQPSHLFGHLPTACQHVSQKPRTTVGGRVGGGPGVFVSQDTQRESKGLRKLNAKVEHSTCPFEKRLHLFSEWMKERFWEERGWEGDCKWFLEGQCGFGSSTLYPAASVSQHCHAAFQWLTLSGVSQMASERSGRNVHSHSQRSNLSFSVLHPKNFIRCH